ncbi:P-loop containing nucleoside triphosphate hydrolase protein, partial [Baffinella frigidus]
IDAALSGKNTIVTTATASGKSLCFNIPALVDPLGAGRDSTTHARALYLYPTKALAQDQLRALRKLMFSAETAAVLDGDTPHSKRPGIVRGASVVLTNPDMLHVSILPRHKDHAALLSSLKFVVIDEAHMYVGAFGAHVALVIRRLRRLCAVYGSTPLFLACSATLAEPASHISQLTGIDPAAFEVPPETLQLNPESKAPACWALNVVSKDGSPCGAKTFVLWNPPLKPAFLQNRPKGNSAKVAQLFAELVRHGLRTIAFCTTRKLSELVLQYCQEALQASGHHHLVDTVMSYRGGYSSEQRRNVEARLFGNDLRGAAATNALELGVDVGSIDATLHLGFQRSIASLFQQAGRAGRRQERSLSIYVAWDSPIDQYFLKNPEKLFTLPSEGTRLDLLNQDLMVPHLLCAANEEPLNPDSADRQIPDPFFSLRQNGHESLGSLLPLGSSGHLTFCGEAHPARDVSLRCLDEHRWRIQVDIGGIMTTLEEVEEWNAFYQIYEGATYMNNGRTSQP